MSLRDLTEQMKNGDVPLIPMKELAKLRVAECNQCDHFRKLARQCAKCGCFVDLKSRILSARCPIDKW